MRLAKFPKINSRKPVSGCVRCGRSSPVTLLRRPVSVLVVVYTDNAEVLLLRRHSPFEFWQSVTGSLDAHELPADAARRELIEETGLENKGELTDTGVSRQFTIDPRWRDRYPPDVTENTEHEWRLRLPTTMEIQINQDEHSAYRWMPIDAAIDVVWSWTNREALQDLRTHIQ
jgi:dATP pyrophosphohydrolase